MTELAPTPIPTASSPTLLQHNSRQTFRRHSSNLLFEDSLSTTSFSSPASSELQPTTTMSKTTTPLRKTSYGSNNSAVPANNTSKVLHEALQKQVTKLTEKTQTDIDTIEAAAAPTTAVAEPKPRKKSFFGKVLRSLSVSKNSDEQSAISTSSSSKKDDKKKEKKSKKTKNDTVEEEEDKIAAGSVISAAQSTTSTAAAKPPHRGVQDEEVVENGDQHNLYYNQHQPRRISSNNSKTIYDTAATKKRANYTENGNSTGLNDGSNNNVIDEVESEKHKQTNLSSLAEVEEAAAVEEGEEQNETTLLPSMIRKDVRHTPASLKIHAKLVDEFRARFQQQREVADSRDVEHDKQQQKTEQNDENSQIYVKPRGIRARPVLVNNNGSNNNNNGSPQQHRDDDSGINEKSPTTSSRSSSSVQVAAMNSSSQTVVVEQPPRQPTAKVSASGVTAFRFQPVFVAKSSTADPVSTAAEGASEVKPIQESPAGVAVMTDLKAASKKKKSLASRLLSSIIRRDKTKPTKSQKSSSANETEGKTTKEDEPKSISESSNNADTLVRKASSSITNSSNRQNSYVAADITIEGPLADNNDDEQSLRHEPMVAKPPPAPIRRQSTKLSNNAQVADQPLSVQQSVVPHPVTIEQLAHSPTPVKNRNRTGSSSSGCVHSEDGGTASSSNNHADDEADNSKLGAVSASPSSLSTADINATSSNNNNNKSAETGENETHNNATAASSSSSGMSDGIATPEPTTLISASDNNAFKGQPKDQNRLMRKNNATLNSSSTSDDTALQTSPSTLACEDEDHHADEHRDDVYDTNDDDDDGVDLMDSSTISNNNNNKKSTVPLTLLQRRGSMRKAREEADISSTPLEQQISSAIQRRNSKRASIRKKRAKKQPVAPKSAESAAIAPEKVVKSMTLPPASLLHKPTPVRLYSSTTSQQQQQNFYNASLFTPQQQSISGCSPAVEHLIAAGLRTAAADANASRNWINSLRRPTPAAAGRQQSVPAAATNNPFSPNWQAPTSAAQSHLNFNHQHSHQPTTTTMERPRSCVSGRLLMEHSSVVEQQRTLNNARARRRSERFKTVELSPTTLMAASSAVAAAGNASALKPAAVAIEIV